MGDVLPLGPVEPSLRKYNYGLGKNHNILPFLRRQHAPFVSESLVKFVQWTNLHDDILSSTVHWQSVVQWTIPRTTFSVTKTTRCYCPLDNGKDNILSERSNVKS